MARSRKADLTPDDVLRLLPEITLEESAGKLDNDLRNIELRRSVLAIADLNHMTELALVSAVARNVRGDLPNLDEDI